MLHACEIEIKFCISLMSTPPLLSVDPPFSQDQVDYIK